MAADGYRRGYVSFAHFLLYFFKILLIQKICCSHSKMGTNRFYHREMLPKYVDINTNSEDPDQTAHVAGTYLSKT